MELKKFFSNSFKRILDSAYDYNAVKKSPSNWTEENIVMSTAESRYAGSFNYDRSPYSKEVIDCYDSTSPVERFAVMKCSQSGFTAGVVIPGICYYISESPTNIMFLSGNDTLVKDTIRDRLDPILHNSGLSRLIRPTVVKKKNQKSGDTDSKKEFAGGSLTSMSYNPSKLRFYSVRAVFADEFDDAPRDDKKEGSILSLVEARTKSFGSTKKLGFISTPTVKGSSNIEEVYNQGDKRKWNWCCPNCNEYIPIEWRVEKEDGKFAGIKYKLNDSGELIHDSVHYECQNCGGKINEKLRYKLNLTGKWIPTAKPVKPNYRSYKFNALCIPPGFDSWVDLVHQWIDACPPGGDIDEGKLKVFINTQLGDVWEEKGKTPKITDLMQNTRNYQSGLVPDNVIEYDGQGKIALITLSCDLGGIMDDNKEDVRLDYEITAHTTGGATYSILHGSIGTFKRKHTKSKRERERDTNRERWTYNFGMKNCVWDELDRIVHTPLIGESGDAYDIDITVIDTGHFTRLAYDYINSVEDTFVIGIKGYSTEEYRRLSKDTPTIKRSREMAGRLYLLEVNQLKDILASNMKLRRGHDLYMPNGFMNFPTPDSGKYTLRSYFKHFEGEHRVEVKKGDRVVGFAWKKKNAQVENHFFDTSVYQLAARDIYIDLLRRSDSRYAKITWDDFVSLLND
jgi:phage terminase large subunit GpA-like protein